MRGTNVKKRVPTLHSKENKFDILSENPEELLLTSEEELYFYTES